MNWNELMMNCNEAQTNVKRGWCRGDSAAGVCITGKSRGTARQPIQHPHVYRSSYRSPGIAALLLVFNVFKESELLRMYYYAIILAYCNTWICTLICGGWKGVNGKIVSKTGRQAARTWCRRLITVISGNYRNLKNTEQQKTGKSYRSTRLYKSVNVVRFYSVAAGKHLSYGARFQSANRQTLPHNHHRFSGSELHD